MAGGETPAAQPAPEGASDTLMHHKVETDAMGQDKRRAVVGQSYGPGWRRQMSVYGAFFAVVAVLAVGFWLLARELDQPPDVVKSEATWAAPDAPNRPTRGIDQTLP